MTEKEKMKKQMLYDANYDKQLIKEREYAKDLCFDFNNTRPSDTEKQQEILKKLGILTVSPIYFNKMTQNEFDKETYKQMTINSLGI